MTQRNLRRTPQAPRKMCPRHFRTLRLCIIIPRFEQPFYFQCVGIPKTVSLSTKAMSTGRETHTHSYHLVEREQRGDVARTGSSGVNYYSPRSLLDVTKSEEKFVQLLFYSSLDTRDVAHSKSTPFFVNRMNGQDEP